MDNLELTRFMNKKSYNESEIKEYPYDKRKKYHVYFKGIDGFETIYATDSVTLRKYLKQIYWYDEIDEIVNVQTKFISINK